MSSWIRKLLGRELKEADSPLIGQDQLAQIAIDQAGSIRVPQVGTLGGAGFGDPITDADRDYAVRREPVAYRVTHTVADDVCDNWFTIDDPRTEGADPDLDLKVQAVLRELEAKKHFSDALAQERTHGWSLIVGAFDDAKTTANLAEELTKKSELKELAVYAKTKVTSVERERNPEDPRFGEPVIYNVNRGAGRRLRVHYTRVIHLQTRPDAMSVLDPIWDDLTNLRNIRWSMGQGMFRYGPGFPVITLPGVQTPKQLKEWMDSGAFSNLSVRTSLVMGEGMGFEFKGAQGAALDPEKYYKPIMESVSVGTGIPEPVLRGAQAGTLTGSEVNVKDYFKVISSIQSKVDPSVRRLIDWIIASGQVDATVEDYETNWLGGFEVSEREQAAAELLREQAQNIRTTYRTVDEVRAVADEPLDPLPNKEGEVVLGIKKTQPQPFGSPAPEKPV